MEVILVILWLLIGQIIWWLHAWKECTNTISTSITVIASLGLGMCMAGPVLLLLLYVGTYIEKHNTKDS